MNIDPETINFILNDAVSRGHMEIVGKTVADEPIYKLTEAGLKWRELYLNGEGSLD